MIRRRPIVPPRPPGNLAPFVRGPIPAAMPQHRRSSAPALRTLAMACRAQPAASATSAIPDVHHHRPAQRRHGRRAKPRWPACAAIFQSGARAWRPGADGRARPLRLVQSPSRGAGSSRASDGAGRSARSRARAAVRPGATARAPMMQLRPWLSRTSAPSPSKDINGSSVEAELQPFEFEELRHEHVPRLFPIRCSGVWRNITRRSTQYKSELNLVATALGTDPTTYDTTIQTAPGILNPSL